MIARMSMTELIERRRSMKLLVVTDKLSLAERFLLPPFSVLDARQGYWQKRKKKWISLGIRSELGRGSTPSTSARVGPDEEPTYRTIGGRTNATPGGSPMPAMSIKDGKIRRGDGRGRLLSAAPGGSPLPLVKGANGYQDRDYPGGKRFAKAYNIGLQANKDNDWSQEDNQGSGTSIFDPVLCEIAYRWFCPQGGKVLDPFAGGSVRGIVAAKLGRSYAGVDLHWEQVEANYIQAETICYDADLTWVTGDSTYIRDLLPGQYDLLFSCPPYADLERYSDDPRDLSTMGYGAFMESYSKIIADSCSMLKDDRFAVFVVGDVRDRETGNYRNFVGDTVGTFKAAGLELYNDAVLVTSVGSLPIRVGRQFEASRKMGKAHQNVLVFLKGDAGIATCACGDVDIEDLEMPTCVVDKVAVCVEGNEVEIADASTMEACLMVDVMRGEAASNDEPIPRVWVGTVNGWRKVDDEVEMSYVVGDVPYLNRALFLDAKVPTASPLAPETF